MGLRTERDVVPPGERAFMLASTRVALEEGDTPIKLKNFGNSKKTD